MKETIRNAALAVGFDACGFAPAETLQEDAAFLRSWLDEGMHGDMHFLTQNFEKRTDPQVLVPGCKTVVVVLMNYFPEKEQEKHLPRIARYAYSKIDYHTVIKAKLASLEKIICDTFGQDIISKEYQHSFVDSAPVLERRWAQKAGLGWIGKHTQLINPKMGSWTFIGVLLLNKTLDNYDTTLPDRCGSCTKCIDACPTQALIPGTLDARKCISYLTIEKRGEIPQEFQDKLSGWKTGCDICQEVCPWNHKKAIPHHHSELAPIEELFYWDENHWHEADMESIRQIFGKSAIIRSLKRKQQL
jgi:epoxyqueuosine reductase